jgi:hypothetical protein
VTLELRIEGNSTTTIAKSNINNKKIFHEARYAYHLPLKQFNIKSDHGDYLCFTLQGFVEVLQLGYKPLIRSHLRPFASNY